MSHRTPVLSYQARHEVLLRFIPAYQQAKPAKKSQLLDQFHVDIWESLQQAFHKPLYMENDANVGALSEVRLGVGQGCKDIAYVKNDLFS